jgi:methylmalonyl-CoA mutase N-terminal domain/subunit
MSDSTKSYNPDRIKQNKTTKKQPEDQAFDAQKEPPATLQTASGIPLKSLYTPEDISHLDYHRQIGLPGQEPFVRGVYPSMYRGRSWTLRQLAGFGPAEADAEGV